MFGHESKLDGPAASSKEADGPPLLSADLDTRMRERTSRPCSHSGRPALHRRRPSSATWTLRDHHDTVTLQQSGI